MSAAREEGFVLPSNQTCGQTEAVNRIVGGTEAPLNAYPWMALLLYNDEGTQNTKLIPKCAGSLITNRFVLTAGHCLNLIGFNLISVRLGEHNIDTQPDCIKLMHGDIKCAAMHLEINIVGKARHVHDIALLKLEFPVRYTDEIRPICVLSSYPSSNPSFENQNFEIAGWGWTEKHEMSDVLLKANIVGRHPNDCSVLRLNNETEICAGGQKGRDTCSKDSGSPLMATMGRGADEFVYLAGITSYGFNACGSGPAVYLKTYKFYEWIRIRMFNL
ncbi:spaetzle-processing enzyme [Drosophila eugracilis]|uniref:spaetzle-processing enzyme n=1 Tax=Drosophila eugracilis TaxID=29029 RepID=UPI001BDA1975|nr:spaetzle-processing enzyme [Drosophila eugracilis]